MMDEENPISLLKQKASKEPFARLLDLEVMDIQPGYAKVQMEVDGKNSTCTVSPMVVPFLA